MEVGDKITWPDFVIGEIVDIDKDGDVETGAGPWYKIVFETQPECSGWYHKSDIPDSGKEE